MLHNERVLQTLASPAGIWALMSAIVALIWATVVFLTMTRTPTAVATLGTRSLLWLVGLSPAIAQLIAPQAVFSNGILLDTPPLSGLPLVVSQGLSLTGLTLCLLIIASQQWAPAAGPQRPGRGPVIALLAIYASVALSAILGGHGGLDRHLIVLPLASIALHVAPRLSATELILQLRMIFRIYIYGSLAGLLIMPTWAFLASSSLGRDYFHIGGQLSGLTPHPNFLGAIAATALIVEWAPVARKRMWPIHVASTAIVLLLTESRTALIAAVIGLMFLRSGYRSLRPMRWIGASAVGALTFAYVFSPDFAKQTLNLFSSSSSDFGTLNGRTTVWTYAYDQFLANPVIGFGPNLFDRAGSEASAGAFPLWAGQAHNQIFQTLGETGIVGAVALVAFVVVLLLESARTSRSLAGLSSAMLAIMLTRFVSEAPLASIGGYDSSFALLFFLMAVIITPPTATSNKGNAKEFCETPTRRLVLRAGRAPLRDRCADESGRS